MASVGLGGQIEYAYEKFRFLNGRVDIISEAVGKNLAFSQSAQFA